MLSLEGALRGLRTEVVVGRRAVAAIGVGATVACVAMAAQARLYLPFTPVPITLQTFFVLMAAAALGPSLATVALSTYLVLGTVGFPLFTGIWLGPTTGYLLGFVVAAWLVGAVVRRVERPSLARIAGAMALGNAVIYALGVLWLVALAGLSPRGALVAGVLPFLPGDALKLMAAAAFCRSYRDRLRQLFP